MVVTAGLGPCVVWCSVVTAGLLAGVCRDLCVCVCVCFGLLFACFEVLSCSGVVLCLSVVSQCCVSVLCLSVVSQRCVVGVFAKYRCFTACRTVVGVMFSVKCSCSPALLLTQH